MKTILVIVSALAFLSLSLGYSQSKTAAPRFQVVETTIDDVHAAMASGKLTAHDLVQAYLARINAYDKQGPMLNCIITLNPHAVEEADKLDSAFKQSGMMGPLHGIPVLVKDEIDTVGMPTTLG